MKIINKRIIFLISLTVVFICVSAVLMFSMLKNADDYALKSVNSHLYKSNILVNAGKITDKNGTDLAYTKQGERKYNDNKYVRTAFLHILGDDKGFIRGGVQDAFKAELSGYNLFFGVNNNSDCTLKLSLDAQLCSSAYKALEKYKGCVAVCNYKTGELVCIASAPSYDIYDKPEDIDNNEKYEGVYINRLYDGLYTPGSIFKIVTAMSAIENIENIYNRKFTCDGVFQTTDGKVICNNSHGDLTFEEALNKSCNVVFAQLAIELGGEKIHQAYKQAGLDVVVKNSDRMSSRAGVFNLGSNPAKYELGWCGIGQSTTLINPYSYLNFICAIANNGKSFAPYYVQSVTNSSNRVIYKAQKKDSGISIQPTTAALLKEMMRSTVSDYYGDSMFGNIKMCGKTGTAEKDNTLPNSLFTGFSYDDKFPYAIIVIVEESGSGIKYAGNIASKILNELYNKTMA